MNPTIAALATPAGEAAIALIRISGPLSESIAVDVFSRVCPPPPRQACLGHYHNVDGDFVDKVLYTFFSQGHSYTGEASLEITAHGNPLIARKILDDLQDRGCRLADPGEFTRTAFLNQQMDLAQAEAVMELIQAKSDKALSVAQHHLQGGIGKKVQALSKKLINLSANLEAYIDFPEEDLPRENESGPLAQIREILREMDKLIETNRHQEALTHGVRLVILGAPNAGKSSLLNNLLDQDRAIVSDSPGTTRDFISERITFGSMSLEIIDTAGLRHGGSSIEKAGMKRTLEIASSAGFFLLVLDTTTKSPDLPPEILKGCTASNTLVVENKIDLPESQKHSKKLAELDHLRISALTGQGLDELKKILQEKLEELIDLPGEEAVVINSRHRKVMEKGRSLLLESQQKMTAGMPMELVASDIRASLETISSITGKAGTEDILDEIFQNFCIGK